MESPPAAAVEGNCSQVHLLSVENQAALSDRPGENYVQDESFPVMFFFSFDASFFVIGCLLANLRRSQLTYLSSAYHQQRRSPIQTAR